MKRFSEALLIAKGACNPSGIAHSIVDACREARLEPNHGGTDALCNDPAIKLMVHQLAFICGIVSGVGDFDLLRGPSYSECERACENAAARGE